MAWIRPSRGFGEDMGWKMILCNMQTRTHTTNTPEKDDARGAYKTVGKLFFPSSKILLHDLNKQKAGIQADITRTSNAKRFPKKL